MFDSPILDVAIGMTFVYLTLSLICTALNESLEAVLRFRSRNLKQGLGELLQDPDGALGILASFYNHPLIDGLYKGVYGATKGSPGGPASLPSYIPSRSFALAILDLIRRGAPAAADPAAAPPIPTAADLRRDLLASPVFAASPDLRRSLLTLIDAAGNDAAQVGRNLEAWYDASMDSIAGWYKRRAQFLSLGFGLLLAVLANADTFALGRSLSRDRALRESLVKGSQDYQALALADPKPGEPKPDPERWLAARVAEMEPLGLPIGWRLANAASPAYWAERLPGWLVTALAISLGAPFWFDLLNRFMVIRSTVKPREKSPEEGSRG